ncbi:MAG: AMP-binding protein, partial [Clostridia bacterium]|nr:AMP-binding protein [Clostridia bacterium]
MKKRTDPKPVVKRDFRELIRDTVAEYSEREAYIIKTRREKGDVPAEYRTVTFREFSNEVRELGTALLERFPAGARIGVMGENRYEWCLSYLAIATSGFVVVPVDKDLNREELIHVLGESETSCIIVSDKVYEKALKQALSELPGVKLCVLMDAAGSETASKDGETAEPADGGAGLELSRVNTLLERGRALLAQGDKKYDEVVIDREAMSVL